MRTIIHYSLHLLFPGLIAKIFYKKNWKKIWGIFLLTMLVDLDHLLATPIFSPDRCSIGFHPFHSYPAIFIYSILLYFKKFRTTMIGLLFHMFTDYLDCLWI